VHDPIWQLGYHAGITPRQTLTVESPQKTTTPKPGRNMPLRDSPQDLPDNRSSSQYAGECPTTASN
jgi:hypothetical protein